MKTLAALLLLAISSQAHAAANIAGITRDLSESREGRVIYVLEAEVCKNSFPGLSVKAEKIAEDKAILNISILSVGCAVPNSRARFFIDADAELKEIGMDAKTAAIFAQVK